MLKKLLRIGRDLTLTLLLTLITQIGGLLYLSFIPFRALLRKPFKNSFFQTSFLLFVFLAYYTAFCVLIVPPLAKRYGRVPMPVFKEKSMAIKPANWFTFLANRHYVKPVLKRAILKTASKMKKERIILVYLDCNFPFFEGFPLLPHKSHDDGEKIDLAFIYRNKSTHTLLNKGLSFHGYGVVESPGTGEKNQPKLCEASGYFQYSLLQKWTSQKILKKYSFDQALNTKLIRELSKLPEVKKIFIEPHLKQRLGLQNNPKVRFHGCASVRHDDHIHVQL